MKTMKRVVVDHFGGPEVLRVVQEDDPRPGPGEVRVRVLAAGVSFTDAQLRAGTYIAGGPKPPFTPGYELVGVVEELGPGCARLAVGDRVGALTVWGADAETVCVPEAGTVDVPEDSPAAPVSAGDQRARIVSVSSPPPPRPAASSWHCVRGYYCSDRPGGRVEEPARIRTERPRAAGAAPDQHREEER
jgi:hypothetical protein